MMGKPLMAHQQFIADVAMEIYPDTGLPAYSEVVIIGPRQATGKTELLLPVMVHRCIGFEHAGPQRVLYTAQNSDEAKKKWRDVHVPRLKAVRALRGLQTSRFTTNREATIWRNGSMWFPGSTTGKTSGTGDTLDLGVIDEAWSRPDNRTELGMNPAMLTRPWAQLWIMSMIPGLSRALPGTWPYLKGKRDLGRARVTAGLTHGTAFFDFSAPDGSDPGDPATWYSAMPGLGVTVAVHKVAQDYEKTTTTATGLVDFCAEYLGWEPQESVPRWLLISQEAWGNRLDPDSQIVGRPSLSVEFSDDRQRAWICAAGRRYDGDLHVEVVEPGYKVPADVVGVGWVENRLADIVEDQEPSAVVIDPRRPAASLINALQRRGIKVLTPNQGEMAGACGRFFDATGEVRDLRDEQGNPYVYDGPLLWHTGQPELDRALSGAKRFELPAGAFTIVKKGQSSELGPLYGVILAMHGDQVLGDEDYDMTETAISVSGCRDCGRSVYPREGDWWHAVDDSPACDRESRK